MDSKRDVKKFQLPVFWFLIKIISENLNNTKSPKYLILQQKNLIENNNEAAGYVKLIYNKCLMEGEVIISSTNRDIVQQEFEKLMTPKLEDNKVKQMKRKFFLIQFSICGRDIIQAVVPETNVYWPNGIQPNQRDVEIFDGSQKRMATILHVSEDEDNLMNEFQKLKEFCFENLFDDNELEELATKDHWLLVLYTCRPSNIVYAIVNSRTTVLHQANDLITYITDGSDVYKAIIMWKSKNLNDLLVHLRNLQGLTKILHFPLDIDISCEGAMPPPGFQSICEKEEILELMMGPERYAELCRGITELEQRKEKEENLIIDFMKIVEKAKQF